MLALIPLLPLIGFLFNTTLGPRTSKRVSGGVATGLMFAAFGVSVSVVGRMLGTADHALEQTIYEWIPSGDLNIPFTLRVDPLSALMILIVTGIGALIHLYSTSYMHEETDSEYARYFSYLNLFAAFMLVLVLGASFPVMFVGWEGVGLCSYLLIGFWFQKPSAADAGKKAFIVNRIGDVGFILGMLLTFDTFGTLDFQKVSAVAASMPVEMTMGTLTIITLLLFVGATGKSAQIPLYVWLPDAMEGPTPVSALIHAATMVTAGVYMIGRTAVLFSHAPITLDVVAVIGVATALMAGTIGLVQTDIKRVLAYSTVSQLGYMFLAMGVGSYAAGIFHLYTHAFFKALLFLGSGAVIHALAGEQDLRRMGGLKRDLPITYWTFLIGALAIAGVPLLSGFFSKDEILFRTFVSGHRVLWLVAVVTSFLTAVYMFRLVFLAFHGPRALPAAGHGEPARGHGAHLHDAPASMAIPLIVLAIGSIFAGYVGVPHALGGANRIESFLEPSFGVHAPASHEPAEAVPEGASAAHDETSLELTLMGVSTVVALTGIGVAAFFFLRRRDRAAALAQRLSGIYRLLLNKYYIDELYDAVIVKPIKRLSTGLLWRGVDAGLIDGTVNGVGGFVRGASSVMRRLQTGSVRAYAASLFFGVVMILGYYLWR
ncbi:MAG TPA: NADH-quinone oxidoreductase subunit L [Vicinamibacterales bacterium]|jgi:NADH-quinone oxidoreductase subunit L|nr:NADH-quinone oxidoreductase subunit L [Vicinamibacterales bacterium]